ncbi:hypothetical protein Slala02_72980 [Streptomyces lavendulae subsp. lavendulae]|nr:hypothetical protein Slala01_71160 [Streptomyces lavendulae subsp. lavendulae]GLX31479.1 hypothetical protein Slala02_72980 [Streptomyces lavendulae subsp. lavendulae]
MTVTTTTSPSLASRWAPYMAPEPSVWSPPCRYTITGRSFPAALRGVVTLTKRQSSTSDRDPTGGTEPVWGQAAPGSVALRMPRHLSAGPVGAQGRSPVGGAA